MFGRRKKETVTKEVIYLDGTTEEVTEDIGYMDARLFVRINAHGNPVPEKHGDGDWYDLATAEDVEMKKGDLKDISLGISIETPAAEVIDSEEAWNHPRQLHGGHRPLLQGRQRHHRIPCVCHQGYQDSEGY